MSMQDYYEESTAGKSREERLEIFMGTYTEEWKAIWDDPAADKVVERDGSRPMKFRDYASHELDMIETDGFDIQDYSEFREPGLLVQLYYPPEKPAESFAAEITECACYAIEDYNTKHGTHYGNVHVVKANSEALAPCRYYITFQATDRRNNEQTFQARVNIRFPDCNEDDDLDKDFEFVKEVELVRIKTPLKPVAILHKASHRDS